MKHQLSICLFLLLSISQLPALTYFVSNSGSDDNSGTNLNEALATPQQAADLVQPGDTVLVQNGTYIGFEIITSGTASMPIVFMTLGNDVLINEPGPTNDGINVESADYIIIDGFMVNDQPRNGIRLALSDHCIVRNCHCDNNFERGIFTGFTDDILIEKNVCTNSQDEHGIYVSNSSDRPVIRYNKCFGNNRAGIHLNGDLSAGGDGIISDAQIHGNELYENNLGAGLNMDGVEDAQIFNNLIYNNHNAQGISLYQVDGAIASRGAEIFNNTIIVPEDGRWGILVNTGANPGTKIYNNIILNEHSWRGCISAESIDDFSSDYNILYDKLSASGDGSTIDFQEWQSLGLDSHSIVIDDASGLFENFLQTDFHLLAEAPAVDAGQNVAGLHEDFAGAARPSGAGYDIGAYEFQGGTTALADILENSQINFHPNPFRSTITLENTHLQYLQFSLKNISGQEVYKGQVIDGRIEVGNLPAGSYALTIRTKEGKLLHSGLIVKL